MAPVALSLSKELREAEEAKLMGWRISFFSVAENEVCRHAQHCVEKLCGRLNRNPPFSRAKTFQILHQI